ncbi:MAG TPA: hypothetical protein VFB24_03990 [Candidatus Binatia bacterium]|nr:hypothetical protein [Candidatus Binatia bacterium]
MAEVSERSYGWGKTQGWLSVFLGVAQFLLVPVYLSPFIGGLLLWLGVGLLRKRRYGFVLVYVVAGVTVLGGFWELVVLRRSEALPRVILTVCFWVIPAVLYYPQRRGEFKSEDKEEEVSLTEPINTDSDKPNRHGRAQTETRSFLHSVRRRFLQRNRNQR